MEYFDPFLNILKKNQDELLNFLSLYNPTR